MTTINKEQVWIHWLEYTSALTATEKIGIINSYTMAQRIFSIIEEAEPLLTQV